MRPRGPARVQAQAAGHAAARSMCPTTQLLACVRACLHACVQDIGAGAHSCRACAHFVRAGNHQEEEAEQEPAQAAAQEEEQGPQPQPCQAPPCLGWPPSDARPHQHAAGGPGGHGHAPPKRQAPPTAPLPSPHRPLKRHQVRGTPRSKPPGPGVPLCLCAWPLSACRRMHTPPGAPPCGRVRAPTRAHAARAHARAASQVQPGRHSGRRALDAEHNAQGALAGPPAQRAHGAQVHRGGQEGA